MQDLLKSIVTQSKEGENAPPSVNFRFIPLPQSYCIPPPIDLLKLPCPTSNTQTQNKIPAKLVMPGTMMQRKRFDNNDNSNSMYYKKYGRYDE